MTSINSSWYHSYTHRPRASHTLPFLRESLLTRITVEFSFGKNCQWPADVFYIICFIFNDVYVCHKVNQQGPEHIAVFCVMVHLDMFGNLTCSTWLSFIISTLKSFKSYKTLPYAIFSWIDEFRSTVHSLRKKLSLILIN